MGLLQKVDEHIQYNCISTATTPRRRYPILVVEEMWSSGHRKLQNVLFIRPRNPVNIFSMKSLIGI
jgi:hypothetical protein